MQYLQARPFVLLTFLIIFLALTSTGCPRRPSEQSGEPAAAFTADITEGVAPLQVQFTDNSTLNKDDSITGWNWNFGDGATSVEQHPQHVFTEQGSYSITLTVTSSAGKSGTLAKENFIVVQAPIENPEGEEYIVPPSLETVILFDNTNLADVSAMPQQELYIEFQTPVKIDTITTEHIVTEETFSTHAITLTEESGSSYGPFQAMLLRMVVKAAQHCSKLTLQNACRYLSVTDSVQKRGQITYNRKMQVLSLQAQCYPPEHCRTFQQQAEQLLQRA